MPDPCPCGAERSYATCCGRYIDAAAPAPSAEALMRSRYCAYVRRDSAYLLRTWSATTRPAHLDLEANKPVTWLGLKVLATEGGGAHDEAGVVEFVARYKVNGKAQRLHERSRFRRHDGQWFYVDGSMT